MEESSSTLNTVLLMEKHLNVVTQLKNEGAPVTQNIVQKFLLILVVFAKKIISLKARTITTVKS